MIGRKLLNIDELPESPLTREIRDFYYMTDQSQTFDEYKKEWERKYDEDCRVRNIEHPVEFDKEYRLDRYKTIRLFKRKGEDWLCSECDMAPNGGSGSISLHEALGILENNNIDSGIKEN